MRKLASVSAFLLLLLFNYASAQRKITSPVKDEVIYHVFVRSFYDSKGDGNGDLNGIHSKLDYLQQLGVTAILMTPLYQSPFYHNYFASDFKKIDPAYGTLRDYLALIREMHRRSMKIYMDMDIQYVTEDHIWWKDSYNNLHSWYRNYILYDDSAHTKPSKIVSGLDGLMGYNKIFKHITTVNLNDPEVQKYDYALFKYWMDPNGDGNFDDGVDGFRLDHMMDNLDNTGRLPHLFETFWKPMLSKLRKVNPRITMIGEQANWSSLGWDDLKPGLADGVFAFRLMRAIRSFNKKELMKAADSVLIQTPKGKQQIVFIENHDMSRFASVVDGDLRELKIGAALNLLLGGVPSIYYGQELGMTSQPAKLAGTDANEVPYRQAFEWYKSDAGKGMAYWYKNSDVGRMINNDIPDDGISLEEERSNPTSLWNYYRALIRLRKANPALIHGAYEPVENDNDQVFTFLRRLNNQRMLVMINLSGKEQNAPADLKRPNKTSPEIKTAGAEKLFGDGRISDGNINLPAYGVAVWKLN